MVQVESRPSGSIRAGNAGIAGGRSAGAARTPAGGWATRGAVVAAVLLGALLLRSLSAVATPDGSLDLARVGELLTVRGAGWVTTLSWLGGIIAVVSALAFPRSERFIQAVAITFGALAALALPLYVATHLAEIDEGVTGLGGGPLAAMLCFGAAAVLPWLGLLTWDRTNPILGRDWGKWLFILPAALWLFALTIFPLVYAFTTSRYAYRNGRISRFVGWDNYRRLIEPENVRAGLVGALLVGAAAAAIVVVVGLALSWLGDRDVGPEARRRVFGFLPLAVVPSMIVYLCATVLNDPLDTQMTITFIFVAGSVVTEMILGLLIALLLNREMRARGALRAIITLPIFATPIALGYLARAIFYEQGGPLNAGLATIGLAQPPWLSDPEWARVATILVDVWQWTPFVFIIALAGLQGLPQDVLEASSVDGATGWQQFRAITLPMIAPILWLIFLLRAIDAFKVLDIPTGLTLGGPGRSTEYFSLFNYRTARKFFDYGGAAAQAFLLLLIVMVLVSLLWGRIRHVYEEEERS